MIIGSHVKCGGKEMLLGSVKEALSYGANTFMFYTGAPQNTKRKPIEEFRLDEALALMKENNIDYQNVIVHAPYIINLANSIKTSTYEIAVDFLKEEIDRCEALGITKIVLHPGAHVGEGSEVGIKTIIKGLNEVLTDTQTVKIALETMAGKGSECGRVFEELKMIIDGVKYNDKLGICLDTCHIHDGGYDLSNFDEILDEFERIIGLNRLLLLHINDSKNERGAAKDRHENFGFGHIGFDNLINVIYNERVKNLPMILETPYIENLATKKREYPPYKHEIIMIKKKKFNPNLIEEVRNEK